MDPATYLPLYPEFRLADAERVAWQRDRKGVVVGAKLARKYGWKLGDNIPLRGTIYSGNWNFTLRGIYEGADASVDENQMLMHWGLINETLRARGGRGDFVGVFVVRIRDPHNPVWQAVLEALGAHATGKDYSVIMEWQQDIALLDSSTSPS